MISIKLIDEFVESNREQGTGHFTNLKNSFLLLDRHLDRIYKNNFTVPIFVGIFLLTAIFLSSTVSRIGAVVIVLTCVKIYATNVALSRYSKKFSSLDSLREQLVGSKTYVSRVKSYLLSHLPIYFLLFLLGLSLVYWEFTSSRYEHIVFLIAIATVYAVLYVNQQRKYKPLLEKLDRQITSTLEVVSHGTT